MKNKKQTYLALLLTISLIILISILNNYELKQLVTLSSLLSYCLYFFLIYVSVGAFYISRFIGFVLFFSIFLLIPNLVETINGQLYPITYTVFISYLLLLLGKKMFKNWKSSTGI